MLTFDEMATLTVEIEATLNNRPLTYVYDDVEGTDQPLTPADLIYGRQIATSPSDRQFDMMSTAKTLTKRAKYQFPVLNTFTKQWQQDYHLSQRERRIVQTRPADAAPVKRRHCNSKGGWYCKGLVEAS